MRATASTCEVPYAAGAQLRVTRNLITQGVLADERPNQKILSAAADGMSPASAGLAKARPKQHGRWMAPRGWTKTAMSDPVTVAPRSVEAGYSIRHVQDRVRVRRAIVKSRTASSLISHNLRCCKSFGGGRENWLKSAGLTPTFVSSRGQARRSKSLAVYSAHLRTFAPSHFHLSGTLRRSSHPSFALANP
jgi:hypothetical protein